MAEVLITLGIIGVVAAITMPTLIQNYKKTVYVNQLKKSVSTLEQGFQKMLADEGVDDLRNTQLWQMIPENGSSSNVEDKAKYNDLLAKYFKIIDVVENEYDIWRLDKLAIASESFSGIKGYKFADGQIVDIGFSNYSYGNIVGGTHIDVNGLKAPNTMGRDVFLFELSKNGHLIPSEYDGSNGCNTSAHGVRYSGYDCAKRIIENGWKMDY